jgi:hypothetical protein
MSLLACEWVSGRGRAGHAAGSAQPAGAEGRKRGTGRVSRSFAIDANVAKLAGTLSPSCTPRVNRCDGVLGGRAFVRACMRACVPATHTLPIYTGTWLHTIAGATRRARVVRTLAEPAPARACMTRVLRRRRLRRHADETEGRPNPAHRRDVALTATTTRSAVPTVRTLAGWGATAQPWCRCGRVQLPFARSDQQPGERELPKAEAGVLRHAKGLGQAGARAGFQEKGNGWSWCGWGSVWLV